MIDIMRSRWKYEEQPNGTWTIWTTDTEDVDDGGPPIGEIVASEITCRAAAKEIVGFHNFLLCPPR